MGIPTNHPSVLRLIREGRVKGLTPETMIPRPLDDESIPILKGVLVPMPPTTNHLYANAGRKGRVKATEYDDWLTLAVPILATLERPQSFPVELCLLILPGKGWRSDADVSNRVKACEDALVKAGVVPDDKQKYIGGARIAVSPERGLVSQMAVWLVPLTEWWR